MSKNNIGLLIEIYEKNIISICPLI